jgi:NTP pyrophosphatase (non-canonical NTP hydrolase)
MTTPQYTFDQLATAIVAWHRNQGGNPGRPAAHALRILREVVELCVAAGATPAEIMTTLSSELTKEVKENRRRLGEISRADLPYECADVQILLMVFAKYNGIDLKQMCQEKMEICFDRKWQVDADGVLWRPGRQAD